MHHASCYAAHRILSRNEIGKNRLIAYASRFLNEHEVKYDTDSKEGLAIV